MNVNFSSNIHPAAIFPLLALSTHPCPIPSPLLPSILFHPYSRVYSFSSFLFPGPNLFCRSFLKPNPCPAPLPFSSASNNCPSPTPHNQANPQPNRHLLREMLGVEEEVVDDKLPVFEELLQHHAETPDRSIRQILAVVEDLDLQHLVGLHRTRHRPLELLRR